MRGLGRVVLRRNASTSSGKFQWDDALLLERRLSEEEKTVRDTARQYAQAKLLPRIVSAAREERWEERGQ
jgi:glutaryl-CoA dehydrogenase